MDNEIEPVLSKSNSRLSKSRVIVAVLAILAVGLALWMLYVYGYWMLNVEVDEAGQNIQVPSYANLLALAGMGTVITGAILAIATMRLVKATEDLAVGSNQLARVTHAQWEATRAHLEVYDEDFYPLLEPVDLEDEPKTTFLRATVRNVGQRPCKPAQFLLEIREIHPDYAWPKDGGPPDVTSVSESSFIQKVAMADMTHVGGSGGIVPPGAESKWELINHEIEVEPNVVGVRIGVETTEGDIFWAPHPAYQPKKPSPT